MKIKWIKYDTVPSTNNIVSELVKQRSLVEGDIVIADYQESGRGQGAHSWESLRGENLLMSLALYPAFLSASEQFHLSRIASLAICDTLESTGVDPVIKWPNDILARERKIGGILIEHGILSGRIAHTIIGIGLNLNQTVFPEFPVPATSLCLETGERVGVDRVGQIVAASLMKRYRELKEGLNEQLETLYREKLFMAGQPAEFEVGGELIKGTIVGVNDYGELKVEREGEIRSFAHGTINMKWKPGD